MVLDCKHAAAVLVVARHQQPPRAVERPEWEMALDRWSPAPPAGWRSRPLACELGVERIPAYRGYAGRQDLRMRPARLGRGGDWVRSGISWEDLDFVARSYVPEHRELLLQFRAAAGAGARYALPRTPWLSLSTVSSAFWGLLDQAAAAGLALITAAPLSGPLRTESRAPVHPRRPPGRGRPARCGPRVAVGDRPLPAGALGVLGEPAHGVFWLQPGADGTEEICLARLEPLLSRELRHLLVEERRWRCPPPTRTASWPSSPRRLRQHVAAQVHRRVGRVPDGRPARAGPHRVLRARPPRTAGLGGCGTPATDGPRDASPWTSRRRPRQLRDPAAEQELVDRAAACRPAERPDASWPAATRWSSSSMLPELEPAASDVELAGEVVDYRQSDAEPADRGRGDPERPGPPTGSTSRSR